MKILILGDIHSRRFWREPVEKYFNKVDKIVFLGDFVDPYKDEGIEYDWQDTLNNFNDIIELKKNNPDKVVLLLGNHDEAYRNDLFCKYAKSTRYDSVHAKILHDMFNGDNYKLFQLCYSVENNGKRIIFTHAGITKFWLDSCKLECDDNIQETINNLEGSDDGIIKLSVIGRCRTWFGEKTGSPLWCDLEEMLRDKGNIGENVIQIFGHTRLKKGYKASLDGWNCLDSKVGFVLNDKNKLRVVCYRKPKSAKSD